MDKRIVEKMRYNKGITIIPLIVTIIILLILAGISLAEFTGSGLFAQAQKAKLETKRSTITEWLDIKLIEEQTNNPSGTAEEIIEATRENVILHQEELLEIGKEVEIEEIKDEEDGKKTEVYFYVIVDEDVYKVELEGVKFIGRKGEFPPIIRIKGVTNTTNTITVTVETQRNEEGKIEFYIEKFGETYNGNIIENVENNKEYVYTFEGLEQNQEYNIKVIAIAKNRKTAEATAEERTGSVPDLTDADIEFTYNPKEWTNGSVKVTASANIDITGYTLKLSTDLKTWSNSVTRTTNGKVYAKLSDNTNQYGDKYATGNVTNIDTTKPVVTELTTTTNSIKITATDEASGIVGYAVTTTNTAPTSFTSCTSTKSLSITVSGKTQGTTYYVWVKDAAGNVSSSKSTATGTVTDLTTANTTFSYNPTNWTNGSVTATASTTVEGYTLQTSKDGKTWTSTASQTFTANGTIYARLYDGTNYGGAVAGNVTNIDKTKPVVTGATSTTNSIKITATDEASGIVGYAVTTTNTAPTSFTSCTSTKSLSTTVSGKTQGTTYYVWVKDAAGNVSASKSTATETVTDLTTSNTTFSYNPTNWTNGSVTAIASTTVEGYTLQTSKDGKTWTSTASQTFTANGTIYARLYDGTNYGGAVAGNVTNIDTTKPTISTALNSSSVTTKGFTLNVGVTDSNSGLSKITWYYKLSTASTYTSATDTYTEMNGATAGTKTAVTKSKAITNLTSGTYNAYAVVYDVAGNSTQTSTINITLGTVTDLTTANTTFSYNPTNWTNGSVTATASTTVTGYTLQTSKDGKTWTSTASQTFTANGTIYARLYDGTNYGGAVAGNVTNIDTTKPVVTGATSTTNSIKITATDEASGIVGYAVTTTNTAPTSFTSCTSTKTLSTTVSGKTQGTTYYVWVKDAAGNVSASKSTATGTIETASGATYTPTTWTNGNVTVTLPTKTGYVTRYTTNGTAPSNTSTQYTGSFTVSSNCTIYYIYSDGTNIGGAGTANITNIDKTNPSAPSITVSSGTEGNNGYYTSNVVVKITAGSDSQSGVNRTTYVLSGATSKSETTISSGGTITISNDGNTTITAYTYDNVGNKSSAKTLTIKKDATPPQFSTINYLESGTYAQVQITATDNIGVQKIKTVGMDNQEQSGSSTSLSYNMNIYGSGETDVTIYDLAGNSVTKTHKIMFIRVTGNDCGNTWVNDSTNNFFPQYRVINNMYFGTQNGNLIIRGTPYSGQGRLGCWHTDNTVSISSDYDNIRAVTWGNITGVPIEIRVSNGNYGGVVVATTSTGDASSSGGYWIRPAGSITSYRGNRQIAIGMNGPENTNMEMYIAACYIYSFRDK